MRAHASIALHCGFPGVPVDLPMPDSWFLSYQSALVAAPWQRRLAKPNLGALTLDVVHEADAGASAGHLSWRSGGVLLQTASATLFAEDPKHVLPDWVAQSLATLPALPLPPSWQQHLERPVAPGESPIEGVPAGPAASPKCGPAMAGWQAGPWNSLTHNCYSYACGARTGIAIPGRSAGKPISAQSNAREIRQACELDGLRYLPKLPSSCFAAGHYIAVIWRRSNLGGFHCYRLNRDGVWSDKDGSRFARNVDDTNRPMTNLDSAWFHYGDELQFVGNLHGPPSNTAA